MRRPQLSLCSPHSNGSQQRGNMIVVFLVAFCCTLLSNKRFEYELSVVLAMTPLAIVFIALWNLVDVECHHESNDVVYRVSGGRHVAYQLAADHQLRYISEVFPGSNYHHAVMTDLPASMPHEDDREARYLTSHQSRLQRLFQDPRIGWIERQVWQPRALRFLATDSDNKTEEISSHFTGPAFNDPFYPQQWYLHGSGKGRHHLNLLPVWRQGLTGQGVSVLVLDDNVNPSNPELISNYDPRMSIDLGANVHGPGVKKNPIHGTFCAAIVAAEANNSYCGVGVAFRAKVGGVRLLVKKRVMDVQEAKALNYRLDLVDIYSASWGPPDDGHHMGGPAKLAFHALQRGTALGRNGLGAIYVWASGNGGLRGDNCGYDSYASSIYTLTVSALTSNGLSPFYAEPCPAALTSLYVGGQHEKPNGEIMPDSNHNVVVPEPSGDGCITRFQGTSAAAPLAAGIIALLLEANPKLTWRDVQHLVVISSSPADDGQVDWSVNGAGRYTNALYGFGALDASRLVSNGRLWRSVPPQTRLIVECPLTPRTLPVDRPISLELQAAQSPLAISLEYAVVTLTADVTPRGYLGVSLQSPSGMISPILAPRLVDDSKIGFRHWNLTSAQFWGENSTGTWILHFRNLARVPGTLHSCSLTLYGFRL